MTTAIPDATQCAALILHLNHEIATREGIFDEAALGAAADSARGPDRDRLRLEIQSLKAQRDDALAAERAASKRAFRERARETQRRHEIACAHAERAATDACERAHELEAILTRAAELFAAIRDAEATWSLAVAGEVGAKAFMNMGPVLSMTAEVERIGEALTADAADVARLGERATSRAVALTQGAVSALSLTPQESE